MGRAPRDGASYVAFDGALKMLWMYWSYASLIAIHCSLKQRQSVLTWFTIPRGCVLEHNVCIIVFCIVHCAWYSEGAPGGLTKACVLCVNRQMITENLVNSVPHVSRVAPPPPPPDNQQQLLYNSSFTVGKQLFCRVFFIEMNVDLIVTIGIIYTRWLTAPYELASCMCERTKMNNQIGNSFSYLFFLL